MPPNSPPPRKPVPGLDVADRLGAPPVQDVRQRSSALDSHRGDRRAAARECGRARRRARSGSPTSHWSPVRARALQGTAGATGFDERPLLGLATEHSVGRFAFDCTHARHAGRCSRSACRAGQRRRVRRLESPSARTVGSYFTGCSTRSAEPLSGRAGTALRPLGRGDERPRARRLADGLVELAMHALDHGSPQKGAARTHLQLTASVDTLMGVPGRPAATSSSPARSRRRRCSALPVMRACVACCSARIRR